MDYSSLIPHPFLYYTFVYGTHRPKIAVCAVLSGICTGLYYGGFGVTEAILLTFLLYEFFIRCLGLIIIIFFI